MYLWGKAASHFFYAICSTRPPELVSSSWVGARRRPSLPLVPAPKRWLLFVASLFEARWLQRSIFQIHLFFCFFSLRRPSQSPPSAKPHTCIRIRASGSAAHSNTGRPTLKRPCVNPHRCCAVTKADRNWGSLQNSNRHDAPYVARLLHTTSGRHPPCLPGHAAAADKVKQKGNHVHPRPDRSCAGPAAGRSA